MYQLAIIGLLSSYTAYTVLSPMMQTKPDDGMNENGGRVLEVGPAINATTQHVNNFREVGYLYNAGTGNDVEEEPETPTTPTATPATPPAPTATPPTAPTTPPTAPTTPPTAPTTPPTAPTTPPATPATPATPPTTSPFVGNRKSRFATRDYILPLYGRRVHVNNTNWNYYVKANKVLPIRVPIHNKGRSCEDRNGCPELYDGDTIFIKELNDNFTVKMYDNYLPYFPQLF